MSKKATRRLQVESVEVEEWWRYPISDRLYGMGPHYRVVVVIGGKRFVCEQTYASSRSAENFARQLRRSLLEDKP